MAEELLRYGMNAGGPPTTQLIMPYSFTAYLLAVERYPNHLHVFDYTDRDAMVRRVVQPTNHEGTLAACGRPQISMMVTPPSRKLGVVDYQESAAMTKYSKKTFFYTSRPLLLIPPECPTNRCARRWNNAIVDFYLNSGFEGTVVVPYDYAITKRLLEAFAVIEEWPGVAVTLSTQGRHVGMYPTDADAAV